MGLPMIVMLYIRLPYNAEHLYGASDKNARSVVHTNRNQLERQPGPDVVDSTYTLILRTVPDGGRTMIYRSSSSFQVTSEDNRRLPTSGRP